MGAGNEAWENLSYEKIYYLLAKSKFFSLHPHTQGNEKINKKMRAVVTE